MKSFNFSFIGTIGDLQKQLSILGYIYDYTPTHEMSNEQLDDIADVQ